MVFDEMTLDEAIDYCEEECKKSDGQHSQLTEWLKELKLLRGRRKLNITGATLLSIEDIEAVDEEELLRCDSFWWLRSRGKSEHTVYCENFNFNHPFHVQVELGVRPALIIHDLASSDFKVGDKIGFGGKDFHIISDKYALCDTIIGEIAFRSDWQADDATDYEASDVKQYVDRWFTDALSRTVC